MKQWGAVDIGTSEVTNSMDSDAVATRDLPGRRDVHRIVGVARSHAMKRRGGRVRQNRVFATSPLGREPDPFVAQCRVPPGEHEVVNTSEPLGREAPQDGLRSE